MPRETMIPVRPSLQIAGGRDPRLDFFRGIAMFIIFISHMPYNAWADYIPARFGFSDAAEIFVFCSGMASAVAFGRLYEERGFLAGSSRIALRCWQVYWAHVGVFMVIAAILVIADRQLGMGTRYVDLLNLKPFFEGDTKANLAGFLTLTYVPNYFDILPMYLVILAMIPIVMALRRIGLWAVFAFVVGTWAVGTLGYLHLPAEPWSDRVWFFNPFCWQLVFFTGFAFMRGWLPAPRYDWRLVALSIAILITLLPFAFWGFVINFDFFREGNQALWPWVDKTTFRPLRLVHFLALAYLAYVLAGEAGRRLRGPFVDVCRKVGQQALGVFLAGQVLSILGCIFLDVTGRNVLSYTAANLGGCVLLVGVAYAIAYFKGAPWQLARPVHQPARAASERTQPPAPARDVGSRPLPAE